MIGTTDFFGSNSAALFSPERGEETVAGRSGVAGSLICDGGFSADKPTVAFAVDSSVPDGPVANDFEADEIAGGDVWAAVVIGASH